MKKIVAIIIVIGGFLIGRVERNIDIEYNLISPKEKLYIFVENHEKQLIGLKTEQQTTRPIIDVFNYLTCHNAKLAIGYKNYMIYSTELLNYKENNEKITLNVSQDFLRGNNPILLSQIYFSYFFLGYKQIYLEVEGNKLEYFLGFDLSQGIKKPLVNFIYGKGKRVDIFYMLDDDNIMPISYFTQEDELLFIKGKLSKINLDLSYKENEIQIVNDSLVIKHSDNEKLLETTIYYTLNML